MRGDDRQISKAKYEVAQERLVESGTDSIATVAHTKKDLTGLSRRQFGTASITLCGAIVGTIFVNL
jgi:hypothetical protein